MELDPGESNKNIQLAHLGWKNASKFFASYQLNALDERVILYQLIFLKRETRVFIFHLRRFCLFFPIIVKQNASDQTAVISDMGHTSQQKTNLDPVGSDHRVRSVAEIWGIFMSLGFRALRIQIRNESQPDESHPQRNQTGTLGCV